MVSRFEDDPRPLTPTEVKVVALVADGLTNAEIGMALGCSEHTVKFHVGNVTAKLAPATGSRTHAAVQAVRLGIVP